MGLGATGLSIARYLQRNDVNAIYFDSREEPPGLEELREICPDAKVVLGGKALPKSIERIIASPGIPDSHPLLKKALELKPKSLSAKRGLGYAEYFLENKDEVYTEED